ncbi:MAG TPA: hypothetical protein VFQ13_12800 [Anaerolineales bacterium]|nr:hypothetical protein [Anaerolineales bacterium]
MFDNLRDSAESSSFYEEEQNDLYKEPVAGAKAPAKKRRQNARFLGMTPQQRFFVSLMLMFTVCIMGTLAMFILGKMSLF